MTLFHKMPFSALYWAGSTLRSFLSQFQGQFEAKNTFFDQAVADLSWHFTKNFIKYKLLFLARSNGALLSRSSISQKLGALQLFEIIRLFKVYGGSIIYETRKLVVRIFWGNDWTDFYHFGTRWKLNTLSVTSMIYFFKFGPRGGSPSIFVKKKTSYAICGWGRWNCPHCGSYLNLVKCCVLIWLIVVCKVHFYPVRTTGKSS